MGRTIDWSGFSWEVRSTDGAPGPCSFSDSPSQVSVVDGNLQLAITQDDGGNWQCAELHLEKQFGYGSYQWRVNTPLHNLDVQAVLGLFTYDWSAGVGNSEIDIEVAKWGKPKTTNIGYSVQPVAKGKHSASACRSTRPTSAASPGSSGRSTSR